MNRRVYRVSISYLLYVCICDLYTFLRAIYYLVTTVGDVSVASNQSRHFAGVYLQAIFMSCISCARARVCYVCVRVYNTFNIFRQKFRD